MQPNERYVERERGPGQIEPLLSGDARQFITFTIGAEEYGIDIMVVREIKGWSDTTMIPNAPPHVRGVINLRGIIVPIFDLRARFGMGLTTTSVMHVVIIVASGDRTLGLLVDTVSDIITVGQSEIRPVPEMGVNSGEQYLGGLVALEDRMVTLVSLIGLFGRDPADADPRGSEERSQPSIAA